MNIDHNEYVVETRHCLLIIHDYNVIDQGIFLLIYYILFAIFTRGMTLQ